MPLRQILCFKYRRRVARDNTVKYHRHTLQLLPSQQRRSYAGAVVVVLEGLDGRLSLQHEGRIIASQDAPPSPGFLRNGNENSNKGFTLTRYSQPSVESKTTALQALTTLTGDERFEGLGANNGDVDELPNATNGDRWASPPTWSSRSGSASSPTPWPPPRRLTGWSTTPSSWSLTCPATALAGNCITGKADIPADRKMEGSATGKA